MRLSTYVEPASIREAANFATPRHRVVDAPGIMPRAAEQLGMTARDREMPFTHVVQPEARLYLADRHSEHIARARGQAVPAAGEITFAPWPGAQARGSVQCKPAFPMARRRFHLQVQLQPGLAPPGRPPVTRSMSAHAHCL